MKSCGRWLGALGFLVAACAPAPGPTPRRATLQGLVDKVFVPMLEAFELRSQELSDQATALCRSPDESALRRTHEAWHAARAAAKRLEVLSFGPHTLPPYRLSGQFDFWPLRPDSVEEVLLGDQPLSGNAGRRLGAAAKGLPAIEYLLFAPGVGAATFEPGSRRCQYLLALGAELERVASELLAVFRDEYAPELLLQPGTERYAHIAESFSEVVNSLVSTTDIVRLEKLGRPYGLKNAGQVQPDKLESRYAPRSIDDAIDTLAGIEAVYYGRFEGHRTDGISGMLQRGIGPQVGPQDAHFERNLSAALASLRAIDGPLEDALTQDRAGVQAALDALRELQIFLQVDLTQALSVTVTFGGSDGD